MLEEEPLVAAQPSSARLQEPGSVLLRNHVECDGRAFRQAEWLFFHSPVEVIRADRIEDVAGALAEVELGVRAGLYASGFLCYEAAPAFDAAFVTRPAGRLPLLWFGLYEDVEGWDALPADGSPSTAPPSITEPSAASPWATSPPAPGPSAPALDWRPTVTREEYREAIAAIKDYIARGHTYQVNYTMRLRAPFSGDPWTLFRALYSAQPDCYGAWLDTGDHVICSASPELFFLLSGSHIVARPMKGTAARGLDLDGDAAQARWLRESGKNRAENLMITDMTRNDLGRIARTGSVRVPRLFEVERFETLFQMTSTVEASTDASPGRILGALFPCASITGAPKVRTMEIIAELETEPRGIYTGAIGFIAPGREARFSVAIRTIHFDRRTGVAEYGTGGGIVWDSIEAQEYDECRTKALVLSAGSCEFNLLETLLWRPDDGYFLLDRHLARLRDSAAYFGFRVDVNAVGGRMAEAAQGFPCADQRVRLLLSRDGGVTVEASPLGPDAAARRWRVALAAHPVDRADRFLYHKTTRRDIYDAARAARPGLDDVILWNRRGEATESTVANLVVRVRGEWLTPPASCGLLAGTFRAELLARGRIREEVIPVEALRDTEEVALINSVRGWIRTSFQRPAAWERRGGRPRRRVP